MKKFVAPLKDPLIHFIFLGGVIFLVSNALENKRKSEAESIVINKEVRRELQREYFSQFGKRPDPLQFEALVERWLHAELLYRKGLELGLDKSDTAIRDRVIQKTEKLYHSLAEIDEPQEQQLRSWYESKLDNYRSPSAFSFEHVFITKSTANAEQRANEVLAKVRHGENPEQWGQNYQRFAQRNSVNLRISFGETFSEAIQAITPTTWNLLESKKGWHVIRVNRHHQNSAPRFEELELRVRADWYKQQQKRSLRNLIKQLKQDYEIIHEANEV